MKKTLPNIFIFLKKILSFNNELEKKFFSPTVKGYFFSCEYKIKIRTNLDSKLITTKKIDIPLQIYVSNEYFKTEDNKSEQVQEIK